MAGRVSRRVRSWAIRIAILAIVGGGVMSIVGVGDADPSGYGQLEMPDTAVMHFPVGRVDITFSEDTDNQTVDVPTDIHVTVTPTDGAAALPVVIIPDNGDLSSDNGVTYEYRGYVLVPTAGDYRVSTPDEEPSIPGPRLLFGPDRHPPSWILLALALAAVLVIVAIVAHRVARRHPVPRPVTAVRLIGSQPDPQPRPTQDGVPTRNSVPTRDKVPAWLYVTGVDGAPPPLLGLGPVRVSGEIHPDRAGEQEPRIPVRDHEVTAPTAYWPQVGATLPIWLTSGPDDDAATFVVLWEAPSTSHR